MIGTKLAHYEITSHLGTGGMGEVYQATDSKLGRSVAIKLLPEAFSRDADRLTRFEREARVLASLNHPHIAAIYGLEESGRRKFLVMELAGGETLAARISRGPIPLDEALKIAVQIAEALDAAHETGVMHRDLKPANIKVTADGQVKVLDFGLAKAFEAQTSKANLSQSPTLSLAATNAGVILGTAGYMSPEQAKGRTVDKRTDIFAFGCVLYEMLTGRPLFDGESASDTLAAVLTKEPEWDRTPPKVQRLLRSCLEKDPRLRLRDIGDAWRLLEPSPTASTRKSPVPWVFTALLTSVALAALFGWWYEMRPTEPPPQPLVQLDVDFGPNVSLWSPVGPTAILSPDGTRLVFVAQGSDGIRRLLTRRLDEPQASQLPGTEGAYTPFFSPNGQWIAFFASGKLKKIRLDGGQPITLCEAPWGRGGSWGEDGVIIAALDTRAGLSRIAEDSGKAALITERDPGEISHRWPQVLPGGKAVLFTANSVPANYDEANIAVVTLPDRHKKVVLEHAGLYPRYLPSGYLIYVSKGSLFAVAFDLGKLEVSGTPKLVLENISSDQSYGFAQFDFSQSGAFLYHRGGTEALRTIHWLYSDGKTESLRPEAAIYNMPRVSPDAGSRLAVVVADGSSADIWVYDLRRGSKKKVTSGPNVSTNPLWSPDGKYLVFQSQGGIFWTLADGADKPRLLIKSSRAQTPSSFTSDGSQLLFFEQVPGGGALIQTVSLRMQSGLLEAGEPKLVFKTSTGNPFPALSPDDKWLAYASAESGVYDVYVRAFRDGGTQKSISTSGGNFPVWSHTRKELFYRTEDQRIMVTTYAVKGDSFIAEPTPQPWSGKQLANTGLTMNFDLAPDDNRFAVVMPVDNPEPRETRSHVTLVVNFFDEVRRRVTLGAK